jgi:hypothetical protein
LSVDGKRMIYGGLAPLPDGRGGGKKIDVAKIKAAMRGGGRT